MENQLVTFETAVLAANKGFDEQCSSVFDQEKQTTELSYFEDGGMTNNTSIKNNNGYYTEKYLVTAPTQSLLQRWLREVYKIDIIIQPSFDKELYYQWRGSINNNPSSIGNVGDTYEETLEVALQESLKLIK